MTRDRDGHIDLRSLLRRLDSDDEGHGRRRSTSAALCSLLDLPADDSGPGTRKQVLGELGDRYEITGELGRGGVGHVCLALDRELGREVAVKTLLHPESVTRAQIERFIQEARITAQLEHPTVVPVYEIGVTTDGDLYYAMKRVDGTPLSRILAGVRKSEPRFTDVYLPSHLLRVFNAVCQGVAFAHDRQVVHGDIKPDNVMVGSYGEVLLLDWGFATRLGVDDLSSLQRRHEDRAPRGALFGTPGYLAPERIEKRTTPTRTSDIYALGCVLYEILALQRVFDVQGRDATLAAAVETDPVHPAERTPGRRIAEDLGDLCLACLSRSLRRRPTSVHELSAAVEAYLAGARQREECERRVRRGRAALDRHLRLRDHQRKAEQLTAAIESRIEAWRPVEDKGPLLAGLRRIEELRQATADSYAEAVTAFDGALSLDRTDPDARSGMADAYWLRFEEAEARGDAREMALAERWLMAYDDGRYAVRIQGEAALTIDSDPTHAEVICLRYERRDMMLVAVPYQELVRTPLRLLPLPMGSYLLVFRAPGYRSTRFPVEIRRREHLNPPGPVQLLPEGAVSRDFVHVPGGRFRCGGDPDSPGALPTGEETVDDFLIGCFPVTAGEYLAFLNHEWRRDPEIARERAPRQTGMSGVLWEEGPEGWEIPAVDRNGNRWATTHPVYGVSWHDAEAYCRWRTREEEVPYGLPTELQWEKAMRGVDSRHYPWGPWFDASLCSTRESHPARPCNRPVGLFPSDVSPYGVHDAAGGVQEWCQDWTDEESGLRRQRGGAWILDRRYSRLANRRSNFAWTAELSSGFRVVRPLPEAGA